MNFILSHLPILRTVIYSTFRDRSKHELLHYSQLDLDAISLSSIQGQEILGFMALGAKLAESVATTN